MTWLFSVFLSWLVAGLDVGPFELPPVRQSGLATGYNAWGTEHMVMRGKRVRVSSGKPYCVGKIQPGQPIIAHRFLPCGTPVYVTVKSTQRGAWMVVGDRGPFGACVHKNQLPPNSFWKPDQWCQKRHHSVDYVWYVKTRNDQPGQWRGIADISHNARTLIGHNGHEDVTLRYWKKKDFRKTLFLVALR